jgi:hypothetical protein
MAARHVADVLTFGAGGVAIRIAITINVITCGLYRYELSKANSAHLTFRDLPGLSLLNLTWHDIEAVGLPVLAPRESYGNPTIRVLSARADDSAVDSSAHDNVATDAQVVACTHGISSFVSASCHSARCALGQVLAITRLKARVVGVIADSMKYSEV